MATPLLTDVTMIYVGGSNLTQTNFSQYYNGSEIVVAGEITDNNIETFTPQVVAYSVRITHSTQFHCPAKLRRPLVINIFDRSTEEWHFLTQVVLRTIPVKQWPKTFCRGFGPTSQWNSFWRESEWTCLLFCPYFGYLFKCWSQDLVTVRLRVYCWDC